MFVAALFCEVKGLEPEGKYFLVRFIQNFGIAEPVSLGVKAFANQFGLSDRQVTKSLKELVECGVMTVSSTPEGRGNRRGATDSRRIFTETLIRQRGCQQCSMRQLSPVC